LQFFLGGEGSGGGELMFEEECNLCYLSPSW